MEQIGAYRPRVYLASVKLGARESCHNLVATPACAFPLQGVASTQWTIGRCQAVAVGRRRIRIIYVGYVDRVYNTHAHQSGMAACVTHYDDVYAFARHAQYELRLMRRSMEVAHVVWTTLIAGA